jgi:hypothetical protein
MEYDTNLLFQTVDESSLLEGTGTITQCFSHKRQFFFTVTLFASVHRTVRTVGYLLSEKRKTYLWIHGIKNKCFFFLYFALGDPECDLGEELCDVEFHILDKSDNISGTLCTSYTHENCTPLVFLQGLVQSLGKVSLKFNVLIA